MDGVIREIIEPKTILVTGANGYIGTRLLIELGNEGHRIIAVVRNKNRLRKSLVESLGEKLRIIELDFHDSVLPDIGESVDAAYYLLHSMSGEGKFYNKEVSCAESFVRWIESSDCKQVIYLGAIMPEGCEDEDLSQHLRSREAVHDVLSSSRVALTTLRASIIVGSGSASFEVIRDLVEKLPIMLTPKWVNTECQPIGIRNMLGYLVGVLYHEECLGEDYDVGGPEHLSYGDMLRKYSQLRGLRRWIIPVPLFSPRMSSHWLRMFTATNIYLARNLVRSLRMRTVCRENRIQQIIVQDLLSYEECIERAFSKIAQNLVPSTWYGSLVTGDLSHEQLLNIEVPTHGIYKDERTHEMTVKRETCLNAIWSLGGKTGWASMQWAWKVRGLLDRLVGGIGMRRGRRHPSELNSGDALDFWRVILADKEQGRLILYAEMKLPGEAWLEYEVEGGLLTQRATFRPVGVMGRLYWYAVYPLHFIIFPQMLRRLAGGWKGREE